MPENAGLDQVPGAAEENEGGEQPEYWKKRHIIAAEGESMAVYAASEMAMPAFLAGTAPVATSDQIIFVLGDFRGDVWLMELEPHPHRAAANSE